MVTIDASVGTLVVRVYGQSHIFYFQSIGSIITFLHHGPTQLIMIQRLHLWIVFLLMLLLLLPPLIGEIDCLVQSYLIIIASGADWSSHFPYQCKQWLSKLVSFMTFHIELMMIILVDLCSPFALVALHTSLNIDNYIIIITTSSRLYPGLNYLDKNIIVNLINWQKWDSSKNNTRLLPAVLLMCTIMAPNAQLDQLIIGSRATLTIVLGGENCSFFGARQIWNLTKWKIL